MSDKYELGYYVDLVIATVRKVFDECLDPLDVMTEALNALPSELGDDEYMWVCQKVNKRMEGRW